MANETCVEWEGTRNRNGYGILGHAVHGSRLAHRAALAGKLGRPVRGKARHTCDNPPCVNPEHLLEGTQADNVADAVARGRVAKGPRKTHCSNNHELTPENVHEYTQPNGYVYRRCLTCRRDIHKKLAAQRKADRATRKEQAIG